MSQDSESGQPVEQGQCHGDSGPSLIDLAKATLADLRRSMRGSRPVSANGSESNRKRSYGTARFSGAGADDRDPVPLADGLEELIVVRGWSSQTAVASVTGRWRQIAGVDLAAHVVPESFDATSGVLRLTAESTTWSTQVRLLAPELMARIDEEIGAGVVRQIEVFGPVAPRRNYGNLRVPGRGPRDTYG